jgi:hypothetical protein
MPNLPWTGFLEKALWGLEEAAARLRDAGTQAEFEAATDWWRQPIRSGVLRGVEMPEETAVSGAIEALFDQIVADQVIAGSPKEGEEDLRQFQFTTEKRRARDPAIGKKTKPTDIAIILRASEIFDLRIEAKTLVADADIATEYLSERGLKRFEDAGNPYTVEPYGGMLAYIIREDASVWQDRVRTGLLDAFGAERIGDIEIRQRARTTSKHSFTIIEKGSLRTINVDVLHLVAEIEARPSLRAASTLAPPDTPKV